MTVGAVDAEVEIAHERLALAEGGGVMSKSPPLQPRKLPAPNSTKFEDVDQLLPRPEREILVGHGNQEKVGGYDVASLVAMLKKRIRTGSAYQLMFYACNAGAAPEGQQSLAGQVVQQLREAHYDLSALAPTGPAFVLAENVHAVGKPHLKATEDSVKQQAVAMYAAALADTLTQLIAALRSKPALPPIIGSAAGVQHRVAPSVVMRPGLGGVASVEAEESPPPPVNESELAEDLQLLKSRGVKTIAPKGKPSVAEILAATIDNYLRNAKFTNIDPVLTKLELFMELKSYRSIVADGGLDFESLKEVLEKRYRRKLLDPATANNPAAGTQISQTIPKPGDPGWQQH